MRPQDKKGKAVRENIELAFDVYCELGGNKDRTLVELEKRGLKLSKPTLLSWIGNFRFDERKAEADAERQRVKESRISFEEGLVLDLIKQKEMYERYFETRQSPDNGAMFAYTNILKTLISASRKIKTEETKDPEEMKRLAEDILRSEYGIER